jgi:hypothetical protein
MRLVISNYPSDFIFRALKAFLCIWLEAFKGEATRKKQRPQTSDRIVKIGKAEYYHWAIGQSLVVVLGLADLYYPINKWPVASTGGTLSYHVDSRFRQFNQRSRDATYFNCVATTDWSVRLAVNQLLAHIAMSTVIMVANHSTVEQCYVKHRPGS